jgi:predicted nucleic acid-binding protein
MGGDRNSREPFWAVTLDSLSAGCSRKDCPARKALEQEDRDTAVEVLPLGEHARLAGELERRLSWTRLALGMCVVLMVALSVLLGVLLGFATP